MRVSAGITEEAKVSLRGRSTHRTICFRPRRALRINLRVRSVTGCSLSAMFASCMIALTKTMGIVDVHVATDRECVAGSSMIKRSRVGPIVICVCAR